MSSAASVGEAGLCLFSLFLCLVSLFVHLFLYHIFTDLFPEKVFCMSGAASVGEAGDETSASGWVSTVQGGGRWYFTIFFLQKKNLVGVHNFSVAGWRPTIFWFFFSVFFHLLFTLANVLTSVWWYFAHIFLFSLVPFPLSNYGARWKSSIFFFHFTSIGAFSQYRKGASDIL